MAAGPTPEDFVQRWYALSGPGAEDALHDIQSMRQFAGLNLGRDTAEPNV